MRVRDDAIVISCRIFKIALIAAILDFESV